MDVLEIAEINLLKSMHYSSHTKQKEIFEAYMDSDCTSACIHKQIPIFDLNNHSVCKLNLHRVW